MGRALRGTGQFSCLVLFSFSLFSVFGSITLRLITEQASRTGQITRTAEVVPSCRATRPPICLPLGQMGLDTYLKPDQPQFIDFTKCDARKSTPWTPFAHADFTSYDRYQQVYGQYFTSGSSCKSLEAGLVKSLRSFCLLSPYRCNFSQPPTEAWKHLYSPLAWKTGFANEIGMLYDDLFMSLSQESPSMEWYYKLLAMKNVMYEKWIANPRNHTKGGTAIIVAACNACAVLEIRLLAIQENSRKMEARNITASLPTTWREFILRPKRVLHSCRLPGDPISSDLRDREFFLGSNPDSVMEWMASQ
jgi:hypothetical protein